MAQDTDELRDQIDQQRAEISDTVDQIETRVNPTHMLARRQDRITRRLTDWKDSVFGNDEPDYRQPSYRGNAYAGQTSQHDHGLAGRIGDTASSASDALQQTPEAVRRQTRGNPLAAGAIALGAGWLIGSLLPASRQEQRMMKQVEPQLSQAATAVAREGQQLADDLKEPVQQAVEEVKQTGQEAAHEIKDQGTQATQEVKDQMSS